MTTVITAIVNGAVIDRYHSSGKAIQQVGWKVLDFQTDKKKAATVKQSGERRKKQQALPAGLARGQAQDVLDAEAVREEDARAEAIHGSHAADRDGDGGEDAR